MKQNLTSVYIDEYVYMYTRTNTQWIHTYVYLEYLHRPDLIIHEDNKLQWAIHRHESWN